jgi:hypothetical protein
VDVIYNDKDFAIPAGWKQDVPSKGIIHFCYCRGQEVSDRVRLKHSSSACWPQGFRERCGIGWVAVDRLKRVQQKLHNKFPDAESSFTQMDLDCGGTLNQAEISVGLFKLGVWLSPQVLFAFITNCLQLSKVHFLSFRKFVLWLKSWMSTGVAIWMLQNGVAFIIPGGFLCLNLVFIFLSAVDFLSFLFLQKSKCSQWMHSWKFIFKSDSIKICFYTYFTHQFLSLECFVSSESPCKDRGQLSPPSSAS